MNFEHEKKAALDMLIEQGVDFDTAAKLVIEKTAGDKMKGFISPAWMEHEIAKQQGKEGPNTLESIGTHMKGSLRAGGRSGLEAVAGSMLGYGVGQGISALSKGRIPATSVSAALGTAGYVGGLGHGMYKSLKNQEREMHDKYREKQAALDMLIEQGVDFDNAVDLVNSKSSELYGN